MKVFISADMEGISGVARGAVTGSDNRDYGRARELMTGDVNAAIEGALEAGATQIVVRDAHGSGAGNLLIDELLSPAELIQGWAALARMMEGIDESFDAALLVGYHARSMTPDGAIAHTMTGQTRRLWYNDIELGEYGISAAHAGYHGVPVVFASGDEAFCVQVKELLGADMATAAVKAAYTRESARMLPIDKAQGRIRDGVKAGLGNLANIKPFTPATPIGVKLEFQTTDQAHAAAAVPTVERVDDNTVAATVPDAVAAADLVSVLLCVA